MSEQKPREFQINIGSYATMYGRPVENYNESILVREVDPAYDAAVQGLVEALKSLIASEPTDKSDKFCPHNQHPFLVAADALANFEKLK